MVITCRERSIRNVPVLFLFEEFRFTAALVTRWVRLRDWGAAMPLINHPKENLSRSSTTHSDEAWNQIGREENKVAVHEEIYTFDKLPENCSSANHHLPVLNKIISLLSLQRTTSEDEELELLLAGLSF